MGMAWLSSAVASGLPDEVRSGAGFGVAARRDDDGVRRGRLLRSVCPSGQILSGIFIG